MCIRDSRGAAGRCRLRVGRGHGRRGSGQAIAGVARGSRRGGPPFRCCLLYTSRVCQYENTSNGDFLIDRHPDFANVWLVGGGSGHGFKHGPAVGEYVAARIMQGGPVEPRYSLATKAETQNRTVF